MKLKNAVRILEDLYPLSLKEDWDHPGLVLGDGEWECEKVYFALDPTPETAREAIEWGANLMITHHPLFFRPVHQIPSSDPHGNAAAALLGARCALWVGHTNVDAAPRGTNEALCERLGIKNALPMQMTGRVRGLAAGLGRVGELEKEMRLEEFARLCREKLPKTKQGVRVAGDLSKTVRRVALMSGSGDGFLEKAAELKADAYLTSDLRHHPALDFMEKEKIKGSPIGLLDVSHFSSEFPWFDFALKDVGENLETECMLSSIRTDPWEKLVL